MHILAYFNIFYVYYIMYVYVVNVYILLNVCYCYICIMFSDINKYIYACVY